MKILLDFHGSIVRAMDPCLKLINYKLGTDFTAYDCKTYEWWKLPKFADAGVTENDFFSAFNLIHRMNWIDALRPYDEHTIRVLRRLSDKHELAVLSSAKSDELPAIEQWLRRHMISDIGVINHGKSEGISYSRKLDYEFDVIIEDHPSLAERFLNDGGGKRTMILLDAPWNRHVEVPDGDKRIVRLSGWSDIENLFFNQVA